MKRIISFVAIAFIAVALCSCNNSGQKDSKTKKEASCCKESKGHDCKHAHSADKKQCCADSTKGKCAASASCCKAKKIVITAYVDIKPDKTAKFLDAVNAVIAKSKAEEGNLSYNLFADLKDKNKFVFVEEWKSQAAVDTHFATEHFKGFGTLLEEVAASPANIKIFQVAAEK
ncbi:MAG: antibiotic biosynthesis monooxygenase [Prevotellaceae bacterium]|jgi:quinol monooxygenase YgiN|nr:antibiotic biosynthesis monooxygenase [Prevotellaceae bacterium]